MSVPTNAETERALLSHIAMTCRGIEHILLRSLGPGDLPMDGEGLVRVVQFCYGADDQLDG